MKHVLTLVVFLLVSSVGLLSKASVYYAPVTGTAGASALVLAQNNLRTYLLIQNTGTTSLIAKVGSTISGSNEGVLIAPGGAYEPLLASTQALYLKAASGSPTYTVIQGN